MQPRAPQYLTGLCGALLIVLTGIGVFLPQPVIGQFGIGYGARLDYFVALACVQGVVYFAAVTLILRGETSARMFWLVLGAALIMRIIALSSPPFLSNDMYRYIWDGWVQHAGFNPYRYLPADPHLAFLRDAVVFPNINRADYAHTIYPPAAEMIFFVCSRVGLLLHIPPVFGMKLSMVVLEGIGIWAMVRLLEQAGLARSRVLIYAWNPLPIWEFAGNGHVDAIAVCFVSLALLAACRQNSGLSAAALAAATLTKFLPVILLPALWRRWDWKFAIVFVALILLLYLPYLGVGKAVLGFLGGYSAQEGIDNGQGIFFLSALGQVLKPPPIAAKIYLIILVMLPIALGLGMVFGQALPMGRNEATKVICKRALFLGAILMAGLSPHYPWYYCWLLIPACVMPFSSTLYLVTASFLLYLNPIHTRLFWPALVFGPFVVLALRDAWAGRLSRKNDILNTSPQLAEGARR